VIVAPFDLDTCPRVSAREAGATRALLAALGAWPDGWQAELPAVGPARVALAGLVPPGGEGRLSFAVTSGARAGSLSVDAAFGARLVDAALGGRRVLAAPRALGPAERGVLAGLLAAALDPLGVAVGLAPPPDARSGGAARSIAMALALAIETPTGAGLLALGLEDPARAAPVDEQRLRRQAARLPVVGRVELAATRLRAAEAAALAPGDAVVFDGVAAQGFAAPAPWPGALVIGARGGGHAAPIRIEVGGAVTVTGGFRAARQEIDMEPTGTVDATAVLAAAPIEVVAELGRITLRGDELLGLAPGAVLSLGGGRGAVALRVGGELYAEGEIVDIDGELGVRVVRVVAR
jgi:type III secretion protein Q